MHKKESRRRSTKITARVLASSLAATLSFSVIATSAQAADTVYNKEEKSLGSAQPKNMGHRLQDVRDWSPQTDPFAAFMRSDIPLQQRTQHDPSTQAHQSLDGKAEIMLMQGDYGNSFFDNFRANNDANQHTLQFWQYADYWSPWHGSASIGTPRALYDPKTSAWQRRGFEFGIVDIPNPAWTNAAHRNGVKSIATIYFDPAFRPALTLHEAFEKDENGEYKTAKKLVEMAKYYGYDGYFLNDEETNLSEDELRPFMKYLTDHGLYTQWYTNSSSYWDQTKASWLGTGKNEIMNSVFLNYRWAGSANNTIAGAAAGGYDPHHDLFFGVEANQGRLDNRHNTASSVPELYVSNENHSPKASIALFTPSDYYHRGLDDDFRDLSKADDPVHQRDGFQWMVDARQRLYFSGGSNNPLKSGFNKNEDISDVTNTQTMKWGGVADFTPARSVIKGDSFASSFNIGRGLSWWTDGVKTGNEQWANMDSQDILPSWQWLVKTEDSNATLTADWDMGNQETRVQKDGSSAAQIPFTPIGAYNGGNSLAIHGSSNKEATFGLYKTQLEINTKSKLNLVTRQVSGDAGKVYVELTFKDEQNPVDVELTDINKETWSVQNIDLASYAGKTLTSINLKFEKAQNYQLNLGALSVTAGDPAPKAPTNIHIDHVYEDGQLVLGWDEAEYGDVVNYRVSALENGVESHLYKGFTNLAYVKNAPHDDVVYRVQAIGKDGQLSAPAEVKFTMAGLPSDVKIATKAVAEVHVGDNVIAGHEPLRVFADGDKNLTVTWKNTADTAERCVIFAQLADRAQGMLTDFHKIVSCADQHAMIDIPVSEGYPVDVTLTPVGSPLGLTVHGETADTLARPMPISDLKIQEDQGKKVYRFFNPSTPDWAGLEVSWKDGSGKLTKISTHVRGDTTQAKFGYAPKTDSIVKWRDLPANNGTIVARLTDTAGNVTEQEFVIKNGEVTSVSSQPEESEPKYADVLDLAYSDVEVSQGETVELRLTDSDIIPAPTGTKFASADLPEFITIDETDGKLTIMPTADTKPGDLTGHVDVTYPDGSTSKLLLKVTVKEVAKPEQKLTPESPMFVDPKADDPAACSTKPFATVTEQQGVKYTVFVDGKDINPNDEGKFVYDYGQTIVVKATPADGAHFAPEATVQWSWTAPTREKLKCSVPWTKLIPAVPTAPQDKPGVKDPNSPEQKHADTDVKPQKPTVKAAGSDLAKTGIQIYTLAVLSLGSALAGAVVALRRRQHS
ncbi:endo-beta-N-acetylglucosaminidase [Arcanobacterium phocae]|uniref:endo-beta-N-acetylglucosaminidase n=1 Tax=Arcanobacterium phocae TaxID=131112 RepID=UPI001C0ED9ED|nr:Rib/alpha-like domain-containing protein [Arcanobacterium phocae]